MKIQKLKDICLTEITDGTHQTPTYSEYGYIFLSSKNVTTQKIDWDNVMFIPEKLHEELYKRVAPQIDDILLAKNGTTGVAAIVDRDIVFDIYVSLALIRPNTEIVMPRYLLYAINNPVVKGYFDSSLKGIGVPNLHLKNIRETPIKIYDLETQKAIVEKLDKVCELISLRKQQLAKLDELVKARFWEMFGDLVVGDKIQTSKKKIGEIASVTKLAGFEFTKYIQYKEHGDIIMLRGLNCKQGKLILDDVKWIDRETSDLLPRSKLYYGDILMTYAGTIGDVAMVDENDKYHLAPNVAKVSINNKKAYNPIFLMYLFLYSNDYIMRFASQVAQASINMEKIRNFEYYFPDVTFQNQFAAFVERVDQQKQTVQQSLEKLELMKKALMQEYFG